MPDLGPYTFEVLLAYGGALGMLFVLLALSIWRSRRTQRRLTEVEERRGRL
ncbi:MAG: heme exporter protein CcmD [Pseudomonadota bacterium]